MQAIDRVLAARSKDRATAAQYIPRLFDDFTELHGDRRFADDQAILAGIARLNGTPVTVVAVEKGEDTKSKVARNFGSAHPEGYRKAIRQFLLAEKFGRPVITLIDTAGAFCGLGAEERGQGQAIAESLMTLSALQTPVLAVLTGEGGSGGALALALADRVWMLENAVYSVISPEGCASILWKDASRTQEAAESLKLTASDLLDMRVIERVIAEGDTLDATCEALKAAMVDEISALRALPLNELMSDRYARFRCMGGVLP
ncbi:MAG: acetyl-CoA carboxylase carboxyl transferase subunit alpha [Clostridiales bacterium]|jgi:acetyl-CoA carboxylase carboxyl transferase subunit alpha|nr:acetyl-CoA carboxylase carboxyl transferase subunit alpha [Clostridiales bacterium]